MKKYNTKYLKHNIISIKLLAFCFLPVFCSQLNAQKNIDLQEKFDAPNAAYRQIGRGVSLIEGGVLKTKDAYTTFGETAWENYEIKFSARAALSADQVQIWAGFRAHNRDDRYVFGFRGGLQNNLYLSRMGYMGADEFLALRSLEFSPEVGKWYEFKIQVAGNRIRVFINNETLPRIDVEDNNSKLAPAGKVTLGGGWEPTEYDSLSIKGLPDNYLNGTSNKEFTTSISAKEKEKKRKQDRDAYQPIQVNKIADARTQISLDGQWLFMPTYELEDEEKAVSPNADDKKWHTMNVPDFWNPIRIWLHGETFGKFAKGVSDTYFKNETDRCENYTFDYKKTSAAWYRQWIELPESAKGKNFELVFDAVSKVAEVYINGTKAGSNTGMFGDFRVDGTKLFKPGKNLVTVKVTRDYIKDIKDAGKVVDVAVSVEVTNKMLKDLAHGFYNNDPAGIWQPVNLIITEPVKITDVYIKPSLSGADFEVTVKNNSSVTKQFFVATDIKDKTTKSGLYNGDALKGSQIKPGEEKVFTYSIRNLKPKLWSPQSPNLYDFRFSLLVDNKEADNTIVSSGFRTFESKNGYLWLNGKQYWLRGGNHTPFALAPNSKELADTFYQIMKRGNIDVTRTHTTPYNQLWMNEADSNGIGISFEGTWPWLMINGSMPEKQLIDLWADEYIRLLKKNRNHPSLLFWTINNEMKFYDNEPDFDRAKVKMKIISDVVKRMRKTDGTRPIVFDSNYRRKVKKFGEDFFKDIDDGDIDDIHSYINWYDHTVFKQFNGEFQQENRNEGRPLISQEMSTGYPNAETGHPTRFYTLVHQTPQSLIGGLSYEYSNPGNFLQVQSFITGELAEALRRSNDKASGILHFALLTWFRNVYDPKKIAPYPTYFALKRALQPVLVSAEIWGRHFYAGEKLPTRICVIDDKEDGSDLNATTLQWSLVDNTGRTIVSGKEAVPVVKHSTREWIMPNILIPSNLSSDKLSVKLVLKLTDNNNTTLSSNEYDLLLANKTWAQSAGGKNKKIVLVDFNDTKRTFDYLKINYSSATSISDALKVNADVCVLAGIDPLSNCSSDDIKQVRSFIEKGGKVLLLNSEAASKQLYPEYITDWIVPTEGDIVNMEIAESPVFKAIEPLELRYFNNNKREVPTVCSVSFKINRNPNVEALAAQVKIHGYVNGEQEQRVKYMETVKGFPIVKIKDKGVVTISAMSVNKAITDPVAGKLLSNMLDDLLNP
ncbi:glycoside hydrolase family 2 protein [Chitinophagaceae bacterium LWZ2-11]